MGSQEDAESINVVADLLGAHVSVQQYMTLKLNSVVYLHVLFWVQYQGDTENGRMEGYGEYTFPNGVTYAGE